VTTTDSTISRPETEPDLASSETSTTETTAETTAAPVRTFADFAVHPDIVEALRRVGIVSPFPIQAMTLPVALAGHDIIGQAKTGTGKTLGFGIPVLQRTIAKGDDGFEQLEAAGKPQALIVMPRRELAVQVAGDLDAAAALRGTRVLTVYGGRAYEPQVEALRRGVEVVVGTPGRLLDLAQQGHLDLSHVGVVVLDEADEMLDLGFLPDVERLLALAPDRHQMMMFSATMPGAVVSLARRFMSQPTHIRAIDPTDAGATLKAIKQFVYRAHAMDKVEMVARLLQAEGRGLTLIFARTKRTVAKVADELADRGFAAAAVHGDLGQGAREQALRAFRNGKVDVLVATDVAARGIDVEGITHVVNYQCTDDEKTYLHRIGRTGRAGHTGVAVTLVDWDDMPRWGLIDKTLAIGIPEPVETYSSSPHFYTDLGIPEGTKGTLPRSQRTRAGLGAERVEDLGETGKHAGGHGHGHEGSRDSGRQGSRARDRGRTGRSTDSAGSTSGSDDANSRSGRGNRSRRRTHGALRTAEQGTATAPTGGADGTTDPSSGTAPGSSSSARRRRRRGGRGRGTTNAAESSATAGAQE
jgi:superfamily II DNA/RNA helicase